MFDGFFEVKRMFEKTGCADPLVETLRVLDTISGGGVRSLCKVVSGQRGIDLPDVVARRSKGEPIEYILGQAAYMGLTFYCSPSALIPREETELLAETALALIREKQVPGEPLLIVDMCTGCGNLAISLAVHAGEVQVLASDLSPEAIELARLNLKAHRQESRVTLFCGDMFAPLAAAECAGRVDLVVCNPPYIPTGSLAKMAPEITAHEPVLAFDGGAFGISIFQKLVSESPAFLKPGGNLVFEIGEGQEKLATRLVERSGRYDKIDLHKDRSGKVRVVSAATHFSHS